LKNSTLKTISESQNLPLDEKIYEYLNKDILEKVNLILEQSKKFMRITHQKKLNKECLLNSIQSLKFNEHLLNKDELFPIENSENNDKIENISIKQYLNEPIIEKPLDTMVFYYWFCIQGFCPRTSINKLDNKKMQISLMSKSENTNKIIKDNHDLIVKMTKNISKELVFFAINLERTFQNVIKDEFLNLNSNCNNKIDRPIQKEMEINATVIKLEPEVVQIFPYILSFLEENIKNKEVMKIPRMQLIILYHLKSVSINKYFDLLTYMNNILELLITLLLHSNNQSNINIIKDYIFVKQEVISFINELMTKYSKYKNDLISSIANFVIPINQFNSVILKSLSAIKCINSFGYEYIMKYIYPNINQIKKVIDQNITFKYKNTIINISINKAQNNNNNNNNNNINNNSNSNSIPNSQVNQNYSQSQSSIPIKTFTIPFSNDFGIPFTVSNFDNSMNQSFNQNNNNYFEKAYFKVINNDDNCKENLITYFYIELLSSISIILNEMDGKEKDVEKQNQIKMNITQIFGEDIVKLFSNK
jgi:hypothetical protein